MSSYAEVLAADRRLVILRLLVEARGESGESALEKGLHMLGHRTGVTRDSLRADLRWLADCDLVVTEFYQGRVMIAKITRRGVACASGHIKVEGVAEPSIGV